MKKILVGVIVFFLALFVYTKYVGPISFSVNSVTTTKSDTFTVSGEGKSTVIPDIATITAGVTANGSTVKQVQQDLNNKINAVSDAIKKQGVDGKDIQTTNYSIYPTYDYQNSVQHIIGYQASTNLTVKVRALDKANSVIDAATANGANQVNGISFDASDKSKAENDARQKAVDDAKTKAMAAARIAGFKLGRIVNYNESIGGTPRPVPMYAKTMVGGMGAADSAAPTTQVEPGSNEVTVDVTLDYQIN